MEPDPAQHCGEPTIGLHTSEALRGPTRALRDLIPDVYRGFAQLRWAAFAPGALSVATKELLALALSVQQGCDGCIAAHATAAARAGAGRQEVAEALGVTIAMGGGPATTWAARALQAFDEATASRNSRPPRAGATG